LGAGVLRKKDQKLKDREKVYRPLGHGSFHQTDPKKRGEIYFN